MSGVCLKLKTSLFKKCELQLYRTQLLLYLNLIPIVYLKLRFAFFQLQVKHCLELGISADSASRLFIFIGLASSLARVVTGRLCDASWVNTIYVHQFGDLLMGIATIVLPLLKGYTGILLFAVVYGVGDGIFVTTINSLLLFTVDEKRRAAAIGMGCNKFSLGIVGGPPLAGKQLFFKQILTLENLYRLGTRATHARISEIILCIPIGHFQIAVNLSMKASLAFYNEVQSNSEITYHVLFV